MNKRGQPKVNYESALIQFRVPFHFKNEILKMISEFKKSNNIKIYEKRIK